MHRRVVYLGNLPQVAQTLKNIPTVILAGWIIEKNDDVNSSLSRQAAKWEIPLSKVCDDTEVYQSLFDWKLDFDIGVIANFGIILKEKTLRVPKTGFINLHFGILPDYPGRNPIIDALRDKQNVVGVTLHRVTKVIDGGQVIKIKKISCVGKSHAQIGENLTRVSCDLLKESFEKEIFEA